MRLAALISASEWVGNISLLFLLKFKSAKDSK